MISAKKMTLQGSVVWRPQARGRSDVDPATLDQFTAFGLKRSLFGSSGDGHLKI